MAAAIPSATSNRFRIRAGPRGARLRPPSPSRAVLFLFAAGGIPSLPPNRHENSRRARKSPASSTSASSFHHASPQRTIRIWVLSGFASAPLRPLQYPANRRDHPFELRQLHSQLFPARRGQRVVARPPFRLRFLPLRLHPPLQQQTLQSGIQRSLFDRQQIVGETLDGQRDPVAVQRRARKRLQDQHVQRSGHQVGFFVRPQTPPHPTNSLCRDKHQEEKAWGGGIFFQKKKKKGGFPSPPAW